MIISRKNNCARSGFTLAELLIVVAIIGVLVAISIPIFSNQLEKAREATDAANIRSQYAEVIAEALTSDSSVNGKNLYGAIELQQKEKGWSENGPGVNLEGIFNSVKGSGPNAGGIAWVEYDSENDETILHYEDGNGTSSSGSSSGSSGQASDSGSGQAQPTNPAQPASPDNTSGTSSEGINSTTGLPNTFNSSVTDWSNIVSINKDNGYTIVPGKVYSSNGKIYFGAQSKDLNAYDLTNNTLDTFSGWYAVAQYTGNIWEENDFSSGRSDLKRGDLCKVGNDYYAFIDGGSYSSGPIKSPGQWVKIIII